MSDEENFVNELARLRQARIDLERQRASLPDRQPLDPDEIDAVIAATKRESVAKIDKLKQRAEHTARRLEELRPSVEEPVSYSQATQELSALVAQIASETENSSVSRAIISRKPVQLATVSFEGVAHEPERSLRVEVSARQLVLSPRKTEVRKYRDPPPVEFIPEGDFGMIARLAESSRREEMSAMDLPDSHPLRDAREAHVKRLIELQASLEEAVVRKKVSELQVSVAKSKKEVQDLLGLDDANRLMRQTEGVDPVISGDPPVTNEAEVEESFQTNTEIASPSSDDIFIYFDFAFGIPLKHQSCRVAYAFVDSGSVISPVRATSVESPVSPGVFVFRAVRLVDKIPPLAKLRLVIELQTGRPESNAGVTSIGWAMFEVFDSVGYLRVGKWKSPVFAPPPQLAAKTVQEMGTLIADGALVCVRVGRSSTHVADSKESVDIQNVEDYSIAGFDRRSTLEAATVSSVEPSATSTTREVDNVRVRFAISGQDARVDLNLASVQVAIIRDGLVVTSVNQPEFLELPLEKEPAVIRVSLKCKYDDQPVVLVTDVVYNVTDGYKRFRDLTWKSDLYDVSTCLFVDLGERPAEVNAQFTREKSSAAVLESSERERTPPAESKSQLYVPFVNSARPKKGQVYEPKFDGIDVYVDGVRFPPSVALATRVKVKITSASYESSLTKDASFCLTKLDSITSSIEHKVVSKLEYRESTLTDPTAEIHFRCECIDSTSKDGSVCTYGFAKIPVFRKPDGSYTLRSSDNIYCLNDGSWQIPVTPRPDSKVRLPLCTLLVRIGYAPKTAGMRAMSKADFPEEDWKDLGIWIDPKASYAQGDYDTSRVGELTLEEKELLNIEETNLKSGDAVESSLLETLMRYRRDRNLPDLSRKDLETWYLSRFDSFGSSTPAPALELGRLVTYTETVGLQFTIDRVHRVNVDLPVVCIVTPVPPLGLYGTPKSSEDVYATMELSFDSPLRSQRFPETWWTLKPEYGANSGVVVEIVAVDVRKTKLKTLGWTFINVFDFQKKSVRCGNFAAPVVQGAVDVELVKAIAMSPSTKVVNPWQVIDAWSSKTKRDPELTVYCKCVDAQLGKEFIEGLSVQTVAALKPVQAYEPREFEGAKKLMDVKPKDLSAMEWERAVRKLVVTQNSLDKYSTIS